MGTVTTAKHPSVNEELAKAKSDPRPMRLQRRDGALLQLIHAYDGVVAKRHLKDAFWPATTVRAMEMRLALLHGHEYLDWPTRAQWQTKPVPEPICWLGWRGALWIAGQNGLTVSEPRTPGEAQLRRLETALRKQGLRWVREPHWSQLEHDLAAIDVRRAVEDAIQRDKSLHLERWVPESEFLSRLDMVDCDAVEGHGSRYPRARGVRPDGYFVIADARRLAQREPHRARFLLEVDMGTADTGSFVETKVVPGLAYVRSPAYKARFGDNSGRWLVVTVGETRLRHLMRLAGGWCGNTFWFSTLAAITATNPLTAPIWWLPGLDTPVAIIKR